MSFIILLFLSLPVFAQEKYKVVIVGDSHSVGAFGSTLQSELAPYVNVKRYAICGASATTYLRTNPCPPGESCGYYCGYSSPAGTEAGSGPLPSWFPGLTKILNEQPDARGVIFALGTNDGADNCLSPASALASMEKLARQIGNDKNGHPRKCYWVGPPDYLKGSLPYTRCGEKYNAFVNRMKTSLEKADCKFVDSREIIESHDGLHFAPTPSKKWAEQVAKKIIGKSTTTSSPSTQEEEEETAD